MGSKTCIGMVTFGNLEFTKLAVNSIKKTSKNELDFFLIVGKPNDIETRLWVEKEGIFYKIHNENRGFPASVNDLYDFAWKDHSYDNLIIVGNDIVAYPYCIDSLIQIAEETDYEMISALQLDVRTLVSLFPEVQKYFQGSKYIFNDFNSSPWEKFTGFSALVDIMDMQLFDIQNCGLYKKSLFDKIGYTDVNFYPAYYIDNDYARRIVNTGIKCCTLNNARFFHFWSRTIHQGKGGSTDKFFENNKAYYILKWGGDFGSEKYSLPFKGKNYNLLEDVFLPGELKISTRENENRIVNYWKNK